jgi:hypothetical protein
MPFRMYELVDTRAGTWLVVYAGRDEALVAAREVPCRRGLDAAAALAVWWVAGDGTTEVIAEGQALTVLAQPPAG